METYYNLSLVYSKELFLHITSEENKCNVRRDRDIL
jgi:hypothetical protein